MASGFKGKVDAVLEMVIGLADEILKLDGTWNDGAGSFWL